MADKNWSEVLKIRNLGAKCKKNMQELQAIHSHQRPPAGGPDSVRNFGAKGKVKKWAAVDYPGSRNTRKH
jgi:hypothetical protein